MKNCTEDGCKKKTSAENTQCGKCEIGICVDYFQNFHNLLRIKTALIITIANVSLAANNKC